MPTYRHATGLSAALMLALTLGCNRADPKPDQAADATAKATTPHHATDPASRTRVELASPKPPKIEVIQAGEPPLAALRLAPKPSNEERMTMILSMRMSMRAAGQAVPSVPIPAVKAKLRATIDAVEDNAIRYRLHVEAVDVIPGADTPDAMLETLRTSMEPMTQFQASLVSNRLAVLTGGSAELPGELPAQSRQLLTQISQTLGQLNPPLPESPVGVGARWRVTTRVEQNGMKIKQMTDYQIKERQGQKLTLDVQVRQELLDPNIEMPGLPGKTKVQTFNAGGPAHMLIDLDHIIPTRSTTDMTLRMGLEASILDKTQKVDMDLEIGTEIVRDGS